MGCNQQVGLCTYRVLVAESQVLLTIALSEFNGVVVVGVEQPIVRHILNVTGAAAAVQVVLKVGVHSRPDLDAGTI